MGIGRIPGTILPRTLEKYKKIDELYASGLNAHQISKEIRMNAYNVGIYLKSKGVTLHPYGRVHKANYDAFETIDSEEKAYWLGFLFADGSVTYNSAQGKPKRYVMEVGLSAKDYIHLEKLKKFLDCTNNITAKKAKLNGKVHDVSRLAICSKKLVEDLIKQGCTPRKSLTLEFPTLDKDLERHFVRGYFDGDGSFHKRTIEILGTESFLDSLQNVIGTNKTKYKPHGKAFGLRLHGKDMRNFYKYMYTDANVYLERKYEALTNYIVKE